MTIDWTAFTPWTALAGGLLIGLAAALFLLGLGRVAGISGLTAQALRHVVPGRLRKPAPLSSLLFLLGLGLAPWLWRAFDSLPASQVDVSTPLLVVAGLLVGVGVRMGGGCTSGHGVCGLSRLSLRSLINVLVFMASGMAGVALLRHLM